ncbi:MAG: metal-dependent hydrolase [Saprospiraceae bacterium]|nr:metal-dependent hydrolase [Saprospiraceae bacterium]
MASIFGHIAASTAIGYAFFPKEVRPITLIVAGFCAFAPDLDVLAFSYGVPYSSEWGHRGWTHSVTFALILGVLSSWALQRSISWNKLTWWLVISTLTHPLLDMMTNGGRGCALWWPFWKERIFLPFRPIQVSPISIDDFFTPWGLSVLASEVIWIGMPGLLIIGLARWWQGSAPVR